MEDFIYLHCWLVSLPLSAISSFSPKIRGGGGSPPLDPPPITVTIQSLYDFMLSGAFQLSSTWKLSFFTRNVNALKRFSLDCAILTTLCSQPFADSLNQKCPTIHIPVLLTKEKL